MKAMAFSLFNGLFITVTPYNVEQGCVEQPLAPVIEQQSYQCEPDSMMSYSDSCDQQTIQLYDHLS